MTSPTSHTLFYLFPFFLFTSALFERIRTLRFPSKNKMYPQAPEKLTSDRPTFPGLLPNYPCVHGTFDPVRYCVCEVGWRTVPKPVFAKDAAACNDTDWSAILAEPRSEPVDVMMILRFVVLGVMALGLVGMLVRRYVVPPPANTEMGPLSDGQKEYLERCERYLNTVRRRDPHFVPEEAGDPENSVV